MPSPIWKDYFVTLGTTSPIQYRILDADSNVLYQGRAVTRPGDTSIKARINEVCADYLERVFLGMSPDRVLAMTLPVTFTVQVYSSGSWTTKDTVAFFPDWSYDNDYLASRDGFCFPVDGLLAPGQILVKTVYNEASETAVLHQKDGSTITIVVSVSHGADFNNDFNHDFARSIVQRTGAVIVLDLAPYPNTEWLTLGDTVYKIGCGHNVLYYVNEYGGYDSLMIKGPTQLFDGSDRLTRRVEVDNGSTPAREVQTYVNQITRRFVFKTGLYTDDESLRMRHLLTSPEVYWLDVDTGVMLPVTLTDSESERKTFRGNGRQMSEYTITAELAQTRIRR